MIQFKTQTKDYWGTRFVLTEADIEQISTHFLEVERPQKALQLAKVVMAAHVAEEKNSLQKILSGRTVYNPADSYEIGDKLVFPLLKFTYGEITEIRQGNNPDYGQFDVLAVNIKDKTREFAANLPVLQLDLTEAEETNALIDIDVDALHQTYGRSVAAKINAALAQQSEFINLSSEWFIKALMADVNVGHLHLTEAILEMSEGGPLSSEDILPHLDMDPSIPLEVQRFSLNAALLKDKRFDEVAPVGQVEWFLKRLEPDEVRKIPESLQYDASTTYNRSLLNSDLLSLEKELDDEWSDVMPDESSEPTTITIIYPHRLSGTLPLSPRIRQLLAPSASPRQRLVLVDEFTNEEIVTWAVEEGRYIYGLHDWFEANAIPIGGFIHLRSSQEPNRLFIGFDRRRAKREWMRLASVADNHIQFELSRRSISCDYDDLMIVGTDVITAIEALRRRATANQYSITSLLAEIFPGLAELAPQKTVHAKTLYSAINMLRRLPPGPIFAELVRHPAFKTVGDHYWQYDESRIRERASAD